jgi:hypothetical protein
MLFSNLDKNYFMIFQKVYRPCSIDLIFFINKTSYQKFPFFANLIFFYNFFTIGLFSCHQVMAKGVGKYFTTVHGIG